MENKETDVEMYIVENSFHPQILQSLVPAVHFTLDPERAMGLVLNSSG